ncbi:LuxR C-terminal-related transcriptional regulator [Mycolicibacterium sp. jd]|uniref:LuxR C-terminal-related transcriptional regulator n=1 Tax=unclassified Mycolicibacterium TaxID=2636767 RepID=UPI00351BC7B1
MCLRGTSQGPLLTEREREVLVEWLRTDSKAAAAKRLFISRATVSTHIGRIRRKYTEAGRPAPTKALLTIRAIQDGILEIDGL